MTSFTKTGNLCGFHRKDPVSPIGKRHQRQTSFKRTLTIEFLTFDFETNGISRMKTTFAFHSLKKNFPSCSFHFFSLSWTHLSGNISDTIVRVCGQQKPGLSLVFHGAVPWKLLEGCDTQRDRRLSTDRRFAAVCGGFWSKVSMGTAGLVLAAVT